MSEAADTHVVPAVSRDEIDHFVDHGLVVVGVVARERHHLEPNSGLGLARIRSGKRKYLFLDPILFERLDKLLREVHASVSFV